MKELLHEWERGFEPMLSASQRYHKTSNIRRTLIGNKIVDHSDVVGAAPVGAAPTTSSFSTWQLASRQFGKDSRKTVRESFKCWDLVRLILETWRYLSQSILVAILLTIRLWLVHKKTDWHYHTPAIDCKPTGAGRFTTAHTGLLALGNDVYI